MPLFCCLPGQAARQVRNSATASEEVFHAKYGVALMVGGTVFCTAVWSYVSGAVTSGHVAFIELPSKVLDRASQVQVRNVEIRGNKCDTYHPRF